MKTFVTKCLRPAVVLTLILTIVTGFLYPGIVTGLAQLIFPYQANGSLVKASNGTVIGSDLIGQYWTKPEYFHGRPSVTVNPSTGTSEPYAADNSTASNSGPTNAAFIQTVQQRVAELKKENPNAPAGPVPVDLVTASGSGLDPDITIAGAMYQVPRIDGALPGHVRRAVCQRARSEPGARCLCCASLVVLMQPWYGEKAGRGCPRASCEPAGAGLTGTQPLWEELIRGAIINRVLRLSTNMGMHLVPRSRHE